MVRDFKRPGGPGEWDPHEDSPLDLGASDEAPPAYGELHDQLNLSQAGFNAGAAVTVDGRVNINIKQTNRHLADLLAPALRGEGRPQSQYSTGPLPPAYIPPSLGGPAGQTPPPKLNVVIQIVGSRGDVQPFVALGKVLKDTYGHRVRIATHATFQKFVEENGLEFFSIGGDPAALMAFMVKNPGLMPGFDALKSGEVARRRKGIEQIVLGCWRSCIEAGDGLGPPAQTRKVTEQSLDQGNLSLPGNPNSKPFVADAIIANPPSFAHIHIAEKMGIPLHMMFTMPWSPTRSFPHPLANIESSNTDEVMTNFVSYALVDMMTWQGLGDVINRFRTKVLDLEPMSLIWAPGLLTRLHIPTTYCWSPALIPKPNDWGQEISIPGFFFLDLATSYTPEPDLAAFLESGPPPVYIGFGSIVVDDPNKLTRMIFDAVTIAGVRALVSKGWGGLGADSVGIPEGVFMLGNCPHDWLFKKVSCVVHHGGAGTTAAGIKTGTPTVVVPFFGDQPFWGSMIARAGAGPTPIPHASLTAESLAQAITMATQPETQARAKQLGERIRQEKGTDLGAKNFHDFLDYDKLRCSIAPSRTAVWRIRKTQVRLSALAAAVLVKEGVLRYSSLKIYRAQEYDTEEQPWDPISAVTSALLGDMGSMAMTIGSIPMEWMKLGKKKPSGQASPPEGQLPASGSHHAASATTLEPTSSSTADTTATSSPADSRLPLPPGAATTASTSGSNSPLPPSSSLPREPSPGFDFGTAIGASLETGKGVTRLVETGMKSPMNFCMGLAKGFRNAPRLYHDETVRKQEKITGLGSGLMVAGKEFGLGFYDGVSGLVTQPIKGAMKEGGVGFVKGFGKGIGGLVLKPASGIWAIPAYMMKGVHVEVRSKFNRSVANYIHVSRILQGQDELGDASMEEKNDIILRFNTMKETMKGLCFKYKGKEAIPPAESSSSSSSIDRAARNPGDAEDLGDEPPRTGFWHTRHLSYEERKKLQAKKDAWKKKQRAQAGATGLSPSSSHLNLSQSSSTTSLPPPPPPPGYGVGGGGSGSGTTTSGSSGSGPWLDNDELDRAIRESVAQTSHGDRAEDARIEEQMRASVREMRRVAEANRRLERERGMRDFKERPAAAAVVEPEPEPPRFIGDEKRAALPEGDDDITEEEFEALIADAVRQSMIEQASGRRGGGAAHHGLVVDDDEEQLRQALEASKHTTAGGTNDDDDDELLKKALEDSERAHQEHLARRSTERSEEEIILEYVKKQSLAEEEFRRSHAKGKGAAAGPGEATAEDEEEALRRAMEESLKVSGKEGGPSSWT